jgi:hypothetical protein
VSLHGKKRLGEKKKEGRHCDKILVQLKEFAPLHKGVSKIKSTI